MQHTISRDGLEMGPEQWVQWPVYWSAVWVGALTAIAVGVIIGLGGLAIGAAAVDANYSFGEKDGPRFVWLSFSVFGAFLSFVAGGWAAGRIAGFTRSEPAMLHGGVVFLVAVPLLLASASLGARTYMGGWYGGLAGTPASAARVETPPSPTASDAQKSQWEANKERAAKTARDTALFALTALLLGLMGAVIGGWMASGEPMSVTYYRTRKAVVQQSAKRDYRPADPVAIH